ncbi:unnamed protein product [Ixodes pacificus]
MAVSLRATEVGRFVPLNQNRNRHIPRAKRIHQCFSYETRQEAATEKKKYEVGAKYVFVTPTPLHASKLHLLDGRHLICNSFRRFRTSRTPPPHPPLRNSSAAFRLLSPPFTLESAAGSTRRCPGHVHAFG